jgi:hypothetical protein
VVNAKVRLLKSSTGAVLEEFPALSGVEYTKSTGEKARRAAIQRGSWELARHVFYFGQTLGHPDVQLCIADLVIETDKPYFYNDVIQKLLAMGPRAVPYLLWSMRDRRTVELQGSLPRLDPNDASRVRVCDVANHALELYFDLHTRLPIDASTTEVNRHLRAWQLQWAKHCAGYLVEEKLAEYLAQRRSESTGAPSALSRAADDTDKAGQQP